MVWYGGGPAISVTGPAVSDSRRWKINHSPLPDYLHRLYTSNNACLENDVLSDPILDALDSSTDPFKDAFNSNSNEIEKKSVDTDPQNNSNLNGIDYDSSSEKYVFVPKNRANPLIHEISEVLAHKDINEDSSMNSLENQSIPHEIKADFLALYDQSSSHHTNRENNSDYLSSNTLPFSSKDKEFISSSSSSSRRFTHIWDNFFEPPHEYKEKDPKPDQNDHLIANKIIETSPENISVENTGKADKPLSTAEFSQEISNKSTVISRRRFTHLWEELLDPNLLTNSHSDSHSNSNNINTLDNNTDIELNIINQYEGFQKDLYGGMSTTKDDLNMNKSTEKVSTFDFNSKDELDKIKDYRIESSDLNLEFQALVNKRKTWINISPSSGANPFEDPDSSTLSLSRINNPFEDDDGILAYFSPLEKNLIKK